MSIDYSVIKNLVLLAACGVAAFLLIRRFGPLIRDAKKSESLPDAVTQIFSTLSDQQQRDATKFGSRKKTLTILVVNTVLLMGWCYLGIVSTNLFFGVFAYLIIGCIANWKLSVLGAVDLAAFSLTDRLWVRIFHAWFWPLYWWAVKMRGPK